MDSNWGRHTVSVSTHVGSCECTCANIYTRTRARIKREIHSVNSATLENPNTVSEWVFLICLLKWSNSTRGRMMSQNGQSTEHRDGNQKHTVQWTGNRGCAAGTWEQDQMIWVESSRPVYTIESDPVSKSKQRTAKMTFDVASHPFGWYSLMEPMLASNLQQFSRTGFAVAPNTRKSWNKEGEVFKASLGYSTLRL